MSRQENPFLHLYHPLPLPSSVFFSLVVVECPHEEASSRQAWWLLNVVTKKHPAGKVFVPFALIIIARILDKIKDIDGSKETLKLVVRITDLWFVGMPNKSEQAEMIIVDSDFLEYLNECQSDGPIIVLLTHARIKEAQGSYPPSVSNSLKASKLVSNELVDEIQEFKDRLSELGIEVHSVMTPRGQGSSQLSACIQCHKKTDIDTIVFTCACGKYNEQAMLRYRLEVMVSHKEENTKFLFWDHECTNLIGQSADEVNRLKIVDGDVDLNSSPKGLDKLLGYVFAFKVKVQPKFRNVVVLKYSRDLSLINTIMELLPDAEASSKIDIAIPDSNDPYHHESQSMSGTADHDPLLGLPLTPTKRQPSQECDDEARSSQISPAQLSSNKLVKHAKIE
ncbi:hypothetical protein JHK85_043574 [Glycine max]|nr:hypothetical protein JHK85_043574 [Glycine max]